MGSTMFRGLRSLLVGLWISSYIFLGTLSHSAFAASGTVSASSNKTLLVSSTHTHEEQRFPSKIHLKRPLRYRDPDDLGM